MMPVSASNTSFDNALPVKVIEIEPCDCGGSAAAIAVASANASSRVASRGWSPPLVFGVVACCRCA